MPGIDRIWPISPGASESILTLLSQRLASNSSVPKPGDVLHPTPLSLSANVVAAPLGALHARFGNQIEAHRCVWKMDQICPLVSSSVFLS